MASITLPTGFQIEPVSFVVGAPVPSVNAPLGVLENFNGSFTGLGFNAIFRPNSGAFNATQFPSDNILEQVHSLCRREGIIVPFRAYLEIQRLEPGGEVLESLNKLLPI